MIRLLCGSANALLGLSMILLGLIGFRSDAGRGGEELLFFAVCALLFLAAASGLFLRARWVTVVAGLPLFLGGILFALFIGMGGPVWSAGDRLAVHLLVGGGSLVALLEIVGIIVSRQFRKSRGNEVVSSGS